MCTNCIVSEYPTCSFRGWGENCDKCKKGKRPKCSFRISVSQRAVAADLLAAATRGSTFGKSPFYFYYFYGLLSLLVTDVAHSIKEFSDAHARYISLSGLAIEARLGMLSSALELGGHFRKIFGFADVCPPEMDTHLFDQVHLFLGALSDPGFVEQLNQSSVLSETFASPVLQDHFARLLPGLRKDGLAEASTSAGSFVDPFDSGANFSPRAPPKKRSRASMASTGSAEDPSPISSFGKGPESLAGPSVPSSTRLSRSASRGSGRISVSGSQPDLKRKRKGRK